jgi:hypothetical protein
MSNCFFIAEPLMKIALVYVYPLDGKQNFAPLAAQFVASYQQHPPGHEHETIIVCNGERAADTSKALFNPLPNVSFIDHDNSGWDIGAFQCAASKSDADIMIFCGSHTYFRKRGWMLRMRDVFEQFGNSLYGSTGNQGDSGFNVYPHVRTTGFWCSPAMMAQYPLKVTQPGAGGQRYEMEHGQQCLTGWFVRQGKQALVVGWDCVHEVTNCNAIPNGFHNGDQSNVLVGDRLTAPPYYHTP